MGEGDGQENRDHYAGKKSVANLRPGPLVSGVQRGGLCGHGYERDGYRECSLPSSTASHLPGVGWRAAMAAAAMAGRAHENLPSRRSVAGEGGGASRLALADITEVVEWQRCGGRRVKGRRRRWGHVDRSSIAGPG